MRGFAHESTCNESKEWYTPRYIFDSLGLRFDMDVCSPGAEVVSWIPADKHLTVFDDGLSSQWNGTVWMNPPYGMDTPKWMKRLKEHGNGIGLVFARTDTGWFHDYAALADAILFISKRVQFIQALQAQAYAKGAKIKNSGSGAGSMLVGFGQKAFDALCDCGLGTLFVRPCLESKHCETVRQTARFGSETYQPDDMTDSLPYENSPATAELQQGQLF